MHMGKMISERFSPPIIMAVADLGGGTGSTYPPFKSRV